MRNSKMFRGLAVGAAIGCCVHFALRTTVAKTVVLHTARYILSGPGKRHLIPHNCFGPCRHPDCIGRYIKRGGGKEGLLFDHGPTE